MQSLATRRRQEWERYRPEIDAGELPDEYFSDIEILPPSQVMGIFGRKGSGKSLLAAFLAEGQYRERMKAGVPAKILYFPEDYKHIHGEPISLQEMAIGSERMNGSIMIWDEAQIILNKFRSSSLANRALIAFLTQVRKRGAFLYYTSNAPKQLDRALNEQTDVHGYCKLYTDKRCRRFHAPGSTLRRHLVDCRDFMSMNWVDTQGTAGYTGIGRDQRIRKPERLVNLVSYYGLYNTLAQVSQAEIESVSRESLADARETSTTGMEFPDFVNEMRKMIAYVVREYPKATRLIPATFARTIKEDLNMDASPERIGKACKALGLKRTRSAAENWYTMPDRDTLHLWERGLA